LKQSENYALVELGIIPRLCHGMRCSGHLKLRGAAPHNGGVECSRRVVSTFRCQTAFNLYVEIGSLRSSNPRLDCRRFGLDGHSCGLNLLSKKTCIQFPPLRETLLSELRLSSTKWNFRRISGISRVQRNSLFQFPRQGSHDPTTLNCTQTIRILPNLPLLCSCFACTLYDNLSCRRNLFRSHLSRDVIFLRSKSWTR